jgi:hypothetical protein
MPPMRLWWGVVAGVALAFGAAAPAGAVQIGLGQASTGPMPNDGDEAVYVVAAPGERNDVTVRASNAVPLTDTTSAAGYPITVTVTDPNATFDAAPPAGTVPCQGVSAHTARCSAPTGTFLAQAIIDLGDQKNSLEFAADTVPMREIFRTGDRNDTISTGPFVGDTSYRWASDTGGGNDNVTIGPALRSWPSGNGSGLALYAGAGNDTVNAANGVFDEVNCGPGNDTLFADPFDSESVYVEDGGTCETRVLPAVG